SSRHPNRYHRSSNPYIHPPKVDVAQMQPGVSDVGNSKIKKMLARDLKIVESTDSGVKELKGEAFNLAQIVSSHSASMKHLEVEMTHLSTHIVIPQKSLRSYPRVETKKAGKFTPGHRTSHLVTH
ncbi:hypothetical protein HAX54_001817, partial [Datura stramonium]|nr:hypothetical protein [Datura stramonium]